MRYRRRDREAAQDGGPLAALVTGLAVSPIFLMVAAMKLKALNDGSLTDLPSADVPSARTFGLAPTGATRSAALNGLGAQRAKLAPEGLGESACFTEHGSAFSARPCNRGYGLDSRTSLE